jgi:hypothetical protein
LAELLLKVLSGIQLFGMVVALLGSNVFSILGFKQVPSWYYTVEKNGIQLAILVYLLLPQILSKYLVTGAFEIVLDGSNTLYSKFATGRLPQLVEIMEPLVAAGLKQVQAQQ